MARHSNKVVKSKSFRSYQILSLKGKSGARRARAAAEISTAANSCHKPFRSKRHRKIKTETKNLPNSTYQDLAPSWNNSVAPISVNFNGEEWMCDPAEHRGSRSAREVARLSAQTQALQGLSKSARRRMLRKENVSGRRSVEDTFGAGKRVSRRDADEMCREPRESDGRYLARVDRVASDMLLRAQYASKYGLHPDQVSGEDQIQRIRGSKVKKTARRLRERKLRQNEKKSAKLQDRRSVTGFEHLVDRVRFGEVVEAPPKLLLAKKKVVIKSVDARDCSMT